MNKLFHKNEVSTFYECLCPGGVGGGSQGKKTTEIGMLMTTDESCLTPRPTPYPRLGCG